MNHHAPGGLEVRFFNAAILFSVEVGNAGAGYPLILVV